MKNLLSILTFLFICNLLTGQPKEYKSYSTIYQKAKFEEKIINRVVTIYDSAITISNYKKGGIKDLILEINNIDNKEYEGSTKKYTWYYCTDAEKDETFGYQKYIIIMLSDKITVTRFADEVTILQNSLLLE